MKRIAALVLAGIAALGLNSCILNPDEDKPPEPPVTKYECIEATCPRDNVLVNLAKAYNERNESRYAELLDDGFIFFFSPTDVQNGTVTSEYWGRADEMRATKNLFDPNYSNPAQEPVQDIDLSLVYAAGDDQWTQVSPEDQVKYPGETWYQKSVTYNLIVKLPGDFQYLGDGKQAAFVLRSADRSGVQKWQIVVWRDDTGTG